MLEPNGTLVLLTPNISTFFTIGLLLVGKMPSSGPTPTRTPCSPERNCSRSTAPISFMTPNQTHPYTGISWCSVFRVLRHYLRMQGFSEVKGYGFGLYPFPDFLQPVLERVDPLSLSPDGVCVQEMTRLPTDQHALQNDRRPARGTLRAGHPGLARSAR